ncbi:DUF2062 domain-containing protein [Sphingosinicella humi]|uniref:DUF2062 domain-containing protein n=1 Tax=Allosphingosinicella humi TaxID=2068657 RepID=A0A2U2IYN4_9SPHN|nr:DUF2062 domain-containing protein [Sphingosinicella humi]PWG01186.1 DUF2062 domain-containing protein [Sphingosinicella humi]
MDRDKAWLARLIKKNMPSREELAENRWIKPFGHRVLHSEFWRFTRRSVPRGVAIGLLVGIFLMIPGLQIIGAALLAVPFRANIPVAAAMTFLSNPATTPFILGGSFVVGSFLGFGGDKAAFYAMWEGDASLREWLFWFASDAAPAALGGLLVVAVVTAAIGYVLADHGWRWWQARKWKRRSAGRNPDPAD